MRNPTTDGRDGAFTAGPLHLDDAALLTDLYELAMAQSYWLEGMGGSATFSLFSRRLPAGRGYLVAAGLDDVLTYLEHFQFSAPALDYLSGLGRFDQDFLRFLRDLRFTGSVRAVPEGTLVFEDEPLLEVTAPIIEAQLAESLVLNAVHFQTLVASKAARCVDAARGRPVIEFGLRRTPGLDAGLKAARSAWIAGATSTSNVLAGRWLGIPVTGTMAHSYVTAFPTETDAFRAFARAFPDQCVLLVDTFDTIAGAHKAAVVGQELAQSGHRLAGVRLDSGDLLLLSREVRQILDGAGLHQAEILASGGLDEVEIERLLLAGAPIDAFGVGTKMDVSADAPFLDMAYKLVRYEDRSLLKLSGGKATLPGAKQVWRTVIDGTMTFDELGLADEPTPAQRRPLLELVMADGRSTRREALASSRQRCLAEIASLPAAVRHLGQPEAYPVRRTTALEDLRRRATSEAAAREVTPWAR